MTRAGRQVERGLFVLTNEASIRYDGPTDPEELWNDERFRDRRSVGIGQRRVMRTRPVFPEWSVEVEAELETAILSLDEDGADRDRGRATSGTRRLPASVRTVHGQGRGRVSDEPVRRPIPQDGRPDPPLARDTHAPAAREPVLRRPDPPLARDSHAPATREPVPRVTQPDPELARPEWAVSRPMPSNPSEASGTEEAHVAYLRTLSSVQRRRGDLVGTTPVDPGSFPPGLRQRVLDPRRVALRLLRGNR